MGDEENREVVHVTMSAFWRVGGREEERRIGREGREGRGGEGRGGVGGQGGREGREGGGGRGGGRRKGIAHHLKQLII